MLLLSPSYSLFVLNYTYENGASETDQFHTYTEEQCKEEIDDRHSDGIMFHLNSSD